MMKKIYLYLLLLTVSSQLTQAQCYPDRHSTNWYDGWVSCEKSANPIASYGETHWIMYDLGYEYVINETKLWNANEPNHLNYGINEFNVDYSVDGVTWTNLGLFNLEQANGSSTYEGKEGPDFKDTKARYVLITPSSNYGGDCFGLSEIKMAISDPFLVVGEEEGFNAAPYPNPFKNNVSLRLVASDDNTPVHYALYDVLGRPVTSNTLTVAPNQETYELPINGNTLSVGIYILKVNQHNKEMTFKLIKRE